MEAFEKLFASVQDPQTQDNHARHLALTKNVLYQNELGYCMILVTTGITPTVEVLTSTLCRAGGSWQSYRP